VVQAGHFEKFLEMIFGQLRLVLEVAFSSSYALLTKVIGSLVTTAVADWQRDGVIASAPSCHP
jgi:hypothetical protein